MPEPIVSNFQLMTVVADGVRHEHVSGILIMAHASPNPVAQTDYTALCPCPLLEFSSIRRGQSTTFRIKHALLEWVAPFELHVTKVGLLDDINQTDTGEWRRGRMS